MTTMQSAIQRIQQILAGLGSTPAVTSENSTNTAKDVSLVGKIDLAFIISVAPDVPWIDLQIRDRNLDRTLTSVLRNADSFSCIRTWVVVVGNDFPDSRQLLDRRVKFLQAPFPPPNEPRGGAADKFRKRRIGAAWLAGQLSGPVFVIGLDADDLISGKFFWQVLANKATDCMILDSGYFIDIPSKKIAINKKGFFKISGTSYVGKYRTDQLPKDDSDKDCLFSKTLGGGAHGLLDEVSRDLGLTVAFIREPVVGYLINHGVNLTDLRGSNPKKIGPGMTVLSSVEATRLLEEDFRVGNFLDDYVAQI